MNFYFHETTIVIRENIPANESLRLFVTCPEPFVTDKLLFWDGVTIEDVNALGGSIVVSRNIPDTILLKETAIWPGASISLSVHNPLNEVRRGFFVISGRSMKGRCCNGRG